MLFSNQSNYDYVNSHHHHIARRFSGERKKFHEKNKCKDVISIGYMQKDERKIGKRNY